MEAWTVLTAEFRDRATQPTYGVFESFTCIRQKNRSTCKHCNTSHETAESPWSNYELSFYKPDNLDSVDRKYTLERLFSESLRPEEVDDWRCEYCGRQGCTREQIICNWPQVLCVAIKRFTSVGVNVVKLAHAVSFPEVLARTGTRPTYRLRSICLHHGNSLNAGHYTACARTDDGWFHCDDYPRKPERITIEEVLSKQNVYGLFYERDS